MKALLDTSALVEILEGNPAYERFDDGGVCCTFHLLEVHSVMRRKYSIEAADEAATQLWQKTVAIELEDVLNGGRVHAQLKSAGASHIDCLGYAMAQRRKIPFVTGGKAFKGMPGVLP